MSIKCAFKDNKLNANYFILAVCLLIIILFFVLATQHSISVKSIVIFASGSGTNAENIINHFHHNKDIRVAVVLSNNNNAKVLERAKNLKTSALSFNRYSFFESDHVLKLLTAINPTLIVLAGFLWKVPENIINAFPNKIINIHPALLPKYGGKGMYGMNVHEAVAAKQEPETGITIHYVNEKYDDGNVIFQAKTALSPNENAENIAKKVHELEYAYFPKVIEKIINGEL